MIKVTCAIIRNEDNQVLVVQRGAKSDHPFKWEFPGGKIKNEESEEDCIIREIKEELSMDVVICSRMEDVDYDYGIKHIILIPFICDTLDELPLLSEHIDFRWIDPHNLPEVDFSEADIVAAENFLQLTKSVVPVSKVDPVLVTGHAEDKDLRDMINRMMSTKEVEWVAASAIENPVIFRKLLGYSYSGDRKLAFHSSWALTKVCDKYPELIIEHLPAIVEKLDALENESALRSFLRILSLSELKRLGSRHHGMLADKCFNALRSGFTAIAIKAYSMEILFNLARIYPELANELSATINMIQGEGSAGIIARGRIIMKKLAEITSDHGSIQS